MNQTDSNHKEYLRYERAAKANEAAFATPEAGSSMGEHGLTKREYFAAAALQVMLSDNSYTIKSAASDAVKAADALLEELNK